MGTPDIRPTLNNAAADPHPGARVALGLLRCVMKLSGAATGLLLALGLVVSPMLVVALLFAALLLVSFLTAFMLVFFYYAKYSLAALLLVVVLFNGLLLCIFSGEPAELFLGVLGMGVLISTLTIRIVGFYPEIETDPPGAAAYLIRAISRLQFSLRSMMITVLWLALCMLLLSDPFARVWFSFGIVCAVGLLGFLFIAVVRANIPVAVKQGFNRKSG